MPQLDPLNAHTEAHTEARIDDADPDPDTDARPDPDPDVDHDAATDVERRRFVVCGDTPLAYRLVDQLVTQYDGLVTVILRSRRDNWGPQISQLSDVVVMESDRLDTDAFTRAGLANAYALGLLDQEDAGNVDAALLAQELCPGLRIVIRMFNLGLGERMGKLLNDCVVLSAAGIAAPAFVAAALDETTSAPMLVADRTLVTAPRATVGADDVVCGLAITADRAEPELLPIGPDEGLTDLVLAQTLKSTVAPRPPRRGRRRRLRALAVLMEARLRLVLASFVVIFAAATATLALLRDMSWPHAALVALISELGGANADPTTTGVEGVTLAVLTVVSIALVPVLTATVVDSAVKLRLRAAAGGLTEPVSDHIVVVGLGNVGMRVVVALHEAGVDVVAIERNPQARGVQAARDRQIPIIVGDASRPEVLAAASVDTCRTLVIVSTDDMTNLETALLGRAANPEVRVVLRLFDGEFADRVQRAFAITTSRSVSYLAAPAFAAAMLGRQIIATIPVRRRVLLLAELPIAAGSTLDGERVSAAMRPHHVRPLAVRANGAVTWAPPPSQTLNANDHLVVIATRAGLSRLLTETATPPHIDDNSDVTLLGEWEPLRTRADIAPEQPFPPTERPDGPRPFGPADAGSTRPA